MRDETLVVSPELALVDAELRDEALALLPAVRPFGFLDRPLGASFPPEWHDREPAPDHREPRPGLAVAAAAYAVGAILRTLAFNLVVFAAVALVVLVVNLAA